VNSHQRRKRRRAWARAWAESGSYAGIDRGVDPVTYAGMKVDNSPLTKEKLQEIFDQVLETGLGYPGDHE